MRLLNSLFLNNDDYKKLTEDEKVYIKYILLEKPYILYNIERKINNDILSNGIIESDNIPLLILSIIEILYLVEKSKVINFNNIIEFFIYSIIYSNIYPIVLDSHDKLIKIVDSCIKLYKIQEHPPYSYNCFNIFTC